MLLVPKNAEIHIKVFHKIRDSHARDVQGGKMVKISHSRGWKQPFSRMQVSHHIIQQKDDGDQFKKDLM